MNYFALEPEIFVNFDNFIKRKVLKKKIDKKITSCQNHNNVKKFIKLCEDDLAESFKCIRNQQF